MSRLIVILSVLAFGAPARSAVVIEKISFNTAPAPSVSVLTPGVVSPLSLSPVLPSASLPSLPSPLLSPSPELKAVAVPAALSVRPLSSPSTPSRGRGPPTAKEEGFGSHVANSVAETVRSWSVPSDEILEEHDALLVGESHHSLASVEQLAVNLPELAKSGVKVVGIEGLKRPSQDAVDDFVSGRSSELPVEALNFSPRRRDAFARLLRSARVTGVRVVALGVPLENWSRETAELAAKKTGDPVETFQGTPGEQLYRAQSGYEPGYNEAVAEVYLTRRNKSMAAFLAGAMNAGVKAVVLVGQNHVEGLDDIPAALMRAPGDWGTLGGELARLGLKAFSLTLTGGLYVDADGAVDDRLARPAAHEKAKTISPDGSPAFTRLGPSKGVYHAGGRVPSAH